MTTLNLLRQLFVALLLGKSLAPARWLTYVLIAAPVGVLVLDGLRHWLRERHRVRESAAAAAKEFRCERHDLRLGVLQYCSAFQPTTRMCCGDMP